MKTSHNDFYNSKKVHLKVFLCICVPTVYIYAHYKADGMNYTGKKQLEPLVLRILTMSAKWALWLYYDHCNKH